MQRIIRFDDLRDSDLIVDAIYEGGHKGNAGDDPISKLLRSGNQGGFRYIGSHTKRDFPYVILFSSFDDYDWPDNIDFQTGLLTYYGDNKKPGHLLHETARKGNLILSHTFDSLHSRKYDLIKPFFVFGKGLKGRDVVFRGVAVSGGTTLSSLDDLQAIWKFKQNQRFQNYKALFTILDFAIVKREWIKDLENGKIITENTPFPFFNFYKRGKYTPLISEKSLPIRKRYEQLPSSLEVIFVNTSRRPQPNSNYLPRTLQKCY